MPKASMIKVISTSNDECLKTEKMGECIRICVEGGDTYTIYVGPGPFYDLVKKKTEQEQARIKAEKEKKAKEKPEVKDGQIVGYSGSCGTPRSLKTEDISNGSGESNSSQKDRRKVEDTSRIA